MPSYTTVLPTLALALSAAAYTWPNKKYEELEHMLVDNVGTNNAGFAAAVTPCSRYVQSAVNTTGRESAAQWQRVMFHDMSTGNIFTGAGGLDASIGFETMRAENKGTAMNDTLGWYANFYNQHVGMADLLALGVVVSSVSCSGPVLDYKGGRIDALLGGASGVPEPDISAQDYFDTMANTGFTETEAIQFLACGHSIGSVHHSGFPEVQDASRVSATNTNGGCPFSALGPDHFNNAMTVEYVNGVSQNPLVVSYNETNRADLRIYSADGNATMHDLASSNDHFLDICRQVYQKAIDTVPKPVSLFDVVPIAVKPVNVTLDVSVTGTITFKGAIRLLGTQFNAASSSTRSVVVAWTGSDKKEYTVKASAPTYGQSLYLNTTNTYYSFSAPIAAAGVQSFVVRVTDGGHMTQYDNNGARFAFSDSVALLPELSSLLVDSASNLLHGLVAAAVHTSVNPQKVSATFNVPIPQVGAMNPTIQSTTVPLVRVAPIGKSNYYLYTSNPGSILQLMMGTNFTTRAVSLAAQGSIDISATQGQTTVVDAFRKIADIGLTMH